MDELSRRVLPMLPVLAAFAETGNTVAAAELLQMPQSTVSRSLTRLGHELGAPVVERHGRRLTLTAEGQALVPHAAAVVAAAEAGADAVRGIDSGVRGTITIAFQNTLGQRVVPALVRAFTHEHPAATVDLRQGAQAECVEAVREGAADVALVTLFGQEPGLETLLLHTEPLVLVVHPSHRFATRPSISLDEAAGETFISMKWGYGMRRLLDRLSEQAGFTPIVAFEGDDLVTLRGLVSAGLGVALTPRDPQGAPGCVEVPISDDGAFRELGAYWVNGPTNRLAGEFRSLLRERGARLTEIGLQVR